MFTLKATLPLALLALSAVPAARAQVTDDFSTPANWSSPRSLLGAGTIQFSGGTASYIVAAPTRNDGAHILYAPGVLPYTSNWSIQVDFLFAPGAQIFTANIEQALGMYLGVAKTGSPIGLSSSFVPTYNSFAAEVDLFQNARNVYSRGFRSGYTIAGDDFYDSGNPVGNQTVTGATVASARVSFDASTKVLSAGYDANGPTGGYTFIPINLTLDVDAPGTNWGMRDTDTFVIYISGNSLLDAETGSGSGPQIVSGRVSADNFQATGLVPILGAPGMGRLANLSILTSLASATDSFTLGYVAGGAGTAGSKPLVVRAVGPSLTPLGVSGALADPKFELFAGSTKTGDNDNWGGGSDLTNAMAAVGAFAFSGPASRDAAAVASVPSNANNSVTISGTGSGTVLAELYDGTPVASLTATTPRLVNVSVLKNIGTGITAGFVVGGSTLRTVLIRAVGPTLAGAPFGVTGVVADPQLALFQGQTKIAENNDWAGTPALSAAFSEVGAFALPLASKDAALLVTLAPGNYSVQVSGVGNTSGTALVEIYEAP